MKTAIRFKQAQSWLKDNVCNKGLFCSVLLYQATLSTIGRLFHDASIAVDANVVPWCLDATNPAALTINKIAGLLTNQDDDFWVPIYVSVGWVPEMIRMMAIGMYNLLGGLAIRCVWIFNEWPWPLGKINHPEVSPDEAARVAQGLRRVNRCCVPGSDGFTIPFKRTAIVIDNALSDADTVFLKDVFDMVPSNNINIEDKFARTRTHASGSNGNAPSVATIASNHTLAEWKSMHLASAKRLSLQ